LIFSDSTCSGVSKISYGFFLRGHLGQLVPQHDVCLFVTMRPAGTRCICELYWHSITSFNNNSLHTIHAPVRFGPASTRDPTATHHLSLPGLRYKTLLTTCQTSSHLPVINTKLKKLAVCLRAVHWELKSSCPARVNKVEQQK
jgi:hypothetical protein